MSEHIEQAELIRWFDSAYPSLSGRLAAVPNASGVGGKQGAILGARFKREGLRKGFPDLILLTPRRGMHGMAMEYKQKNGKLDEDQEDWLLWLNKQGYYVTVAFGLEEAVKAIDWYLGN